MIRPVSSSPAGAKASIAGTDPIAAKRLVLATDLDGTFLGGSTAEREQLYRWIERNRDTVGLIFVTGREVGFIRQLTSDGCVPRPDFVVADVGTTIAAPDAEAGFAPIAALEAEIAARWGDAGARVRTALADVGGLSLQPTDFRYRVSYDMNPDRFDQRAFGIVADLGLDALASDNRFFDVLPRGISKGPSLRRLLADLGVPDQRVLVAGDTLNDLSMLALGLPAVAVGNSEPALLAQLSGHDHVHRAKAEGAAGIAEAIRRFGYLSHNAA
ncbi:MAG: HAD hydrolase family protein [Pararhodobacter sp.]|nr:HAD hydrolase family protein [Pararhodobacter sp.]